MRKKVLLVDDDRDILLLLKNRLEKAGYDVIVTAHPSAVVRIVHEDPPDLILCDIDMEERPGSEVAADLASDETGRKIPLVFLSSLVTPGDVDADGNVGGLRMISKATPIDRIVDRVREILREV